MKSYKFSTKKQSKAEVIFGITVVVGFIIYYQYHNVVDTNIIRLLIAIAVFISILISLRAVSTNFSEVIITEDKYKFIFIRKNKDALTIPKKDVRVKLLKEKVEFINKGNNKTIGYSYKNRIVDREQWDEFIEDLDIASLIKFTNK